MEKADSDTIRNISEAIRDNNDLSIKYDKQGIAISTPDHNEIMTRSVRQNVTQEFIKEINIETVVGNVADRLGEQSDASDIPVESGWVNMFIDSAGYISDPDLQKLWGAILAAEIVEPGHISLRTIETVRRLSREEAKLFDKVAEYVLYI